MRENFSYKGSWFSPDNPSHQIVGTLSFEYNKNTILELVGQFTIGKKKISEADIILGITTDGKFITLYKCYEIQRTLSLPMGGSTTKWSIIFTISGGHFYKKEDLKFHLAAISFHNFNEWLGVSGFKINPTDYKKNKSKVVYSLPK